MGRAILLIIDGLGIGAQEDADLYGDENADTLGNVSLISKCRLPNFEFLGLGNIRELKSVKPVDDPRASYGKMREVSGGKDSTSGHWEIAGIHLGNPFPTYPRGFPDHLIQKFCKETGAGNVLCNLPYSGTNVIEDFGEEHIKSGFPIVYTSADSVFQVACHTSITPVETLYRWCRIAREKVMVGDHAVGRVIARPFEGGAGSFERISEKRHDYSLTPPTPNLLSLLLEKGVKNYSIGKVIDLFADQGFTQFRRTKSNAEGISQLLSLMNAGIENSFVFVNLIDTDQIYGHRQDPVGFGRALEEIDRALPAILGKLRKDDLLIITGDHGNDPADNSTDHTREFVPVLALSGDSSAGKNIGIRETFSDAAVTILEKFGIPSELPGRSFFKSINGG